MPNPSKTKTAVKSRGKRVSVDCIKTRPSYDIAYCENLECPKRDVCQRSSERAPFYLPVYVQTFVLDHNGECDYYVPLKESEAGTQMSLPQEATE